MDDYLGWNEWVVEVARLLESKGIYSDKVRPPFKTYVNEIVFKNFPHLRSDYRKGASPEEATMWILKCYMKHKEFSDIVQ